MEGALAYQSNLHCAYTWSRVATLMRLFTCSSDDNDRVVWRVQSSFVLCTCIHMLACSEPCAAVDIRFIVQMMIKFLGCPVKFVFVYWENPIIACSEWTCWYTGCWWTVDHVVWPDPSSLCCVLTIMCRNKALDIWFVVQHLIMLTTRAVKFMLYTHTYMSLAEVQWAKLLGLLFGFWGCFWHVQSSLRVCWHIPHMSQAYTHMRRSQLNCLIAWLVACPQVFRDREIGVCATNQPRDTLLQIVENDLSRDAKATEQTETCAFACCDFFLREVNLTKFIPI